MNTTEIETSLKTLYRYMCVCVCVVDGTIIVVSKMALLDCLYCLAEVAHLPSNKKPSCLYSIRRFCKQMQNAVFVPFDSCRLYQTGHCRDAEGSSDVAVKDFFFFIDCYFFIY